MPDQRADNAPQPEDDYDRIDALEAAGICVVCEKAPAVPDDCMCADCRQWVTDNSVVVMDPIEKLIGQHRLVAFLTDLDNGECLCRHHHRAKHTVFTVQHDPDSGDHVWITRGGWTFRRHPQGY